MRPAPESATAGDPAIEAALGRSTCGRQLALAGRPCRGNLADRKRGRSERRAGRRLPLHRRLAGRCQRPTAIGPAALFETVTGYPDFRVLAGLLASHAAALPCCSTPRPTSWRSSCWRRCADHSTQCPLPAAAPCRGGGPPGAGHPRAVAAGIDEHAARRRPVFHPGHRSRWRPRHRRDDVTIHRLCVQGPDTLSIYFAPMRHIDVFRQKAEARGEPLPVSINIGLDPAIYLAVCFEAPTTPLGVDELSIAGGLRGPASRDGAARPE
ncbi:MAG: UbiD family decarboxylase [Gemmataceae bacterium]